MNINDLQKRIDVFEKERAWDKFPESLIYIHLIEEITEIGRVILEEEGYKVKELGHAPSGKKPRERICPSLNPINSTSKQIQNRPTKKPRKRDRKNGKTIPKRKMEKISRK